VVPGLQHRDPRQVGGNGDEPDPRLPALLECGDVRDVVRQGRAAGAPALAAVEHPAVAGAGEVGGGGAAAGRRPEIRLGAQAVGEGDAPRRPGQEILVVRLVPRHRHGADGAVGQQGVGQDDRDRRVALADGRHRAGGIARRDAGPAVLRCDRCRDEARAVDGLQPLPGDLAGTVVLRGALGDLGRHLREPVVGQVGYGEGVRGRGLGGGGHDVTPRTRRPAASSAASSCGGCTRTHRALRRCRSRPW
jgi:hypothetical protein